MKVLRKLSRPFTWVMGVSIAMAVVLVFILADLFFNVNDYPQG